MLLLPYLVAQLVGKWSHFWQISGILPTNQGRRDSFQENVLWVITKGKTIDFSHVIKWMMFIHFKIMGWKWYLWSMPASSANVAGHRYVRAAAASMARLRVAPAR